MKIVFAICCVFALGKAFPVEDNNLFQIHSTSTQSDNINPLGHKRNPREISDYYFGTNTYPYLIPSNPYYEYDVEQGLWRPKCKNFINSNYVSSGYVGPSRRRASRRQGYNGRRIHRGHSAMFEALRGTFG